MCWATQKNTAPRAPREGHKGLLDAARQTDGSWTEAVRFPYDFYTSYGAREGLARTSSDTHMIMLEIIWVP